LDPFLVVIRRMPLTAIGSEYSGLAKLDHGFRLDFG